MYSPTSLPGDKCLALEMKRPLDTRILKLRFDILYILNGDVKIIRNIFKA